MDEAALRKLTNSLELSELQCNGDMGAPQYAQLMLLYLIENDLSQCKLLWKRLPDNVKRHADLEKVWHLVCSLHERQLNLCIRLCQGDGITWPDYMNDFLEILVRKIRQRYLNSVALAYSSIRLAELCYATVLSVDQIKPLLAERGWTLDVDQLVTPVYPSGVQNVTDAQLAAAEKLLRTLTSYASFVEH